MSVSIFHIQWTFILLLCLRPLSSASQVGRSTPLPPPRSVLPLVFLCSYFLHVSADHIPQSQPLSTSASPSRYFGQPNRFEVFLWSSPHCPCHLNRSQGDLCDFHEPSYVIICPVLVQGYSTNPSQHPHLYTFQYSLVSFHFTFSFKSRFPLHYLCTSCKNILNSLHISIENRWSLLFKMTSTLFLLKLSMNVAGRETVSNRAMEILWCAINKLR